MNSSNIESNIEEINNTFYFYKIVSKDVNDKCCYIGKTKNYSVRVSTHKSNSRFSNIKLYQHIRNNGGFINFNIEVIHKSNCDEKTSIFLELYFINYYRNNNFEILNIQNPNIYPREEYNKKKCQEHYAINVDCECGWNGSKMNYCKHLKKSKKHRQYCIKQIENNLECVMIIQDGLKPAKFTFIKK